MRHRTLDTRISLSASKCLYEKDGAIRTSWEVPPADPLWRLVVVRAAGEWMYVRWWASRPDKQQVIPAALDALRRDHTNLGMSVVPASVERRCIGLTKAIKGAGQRTRYALHNADARADATAYADKFVFVVNDTLRMLGQGPTHVAELTRAVGEVLTVQTDGIVGTHRGEMGLAERICVARGVDPYVGREWARKASVVPQTKRATTETTHECAWQ